MQRTRETIAAFSEGIKRLRYKGPLFLGGILLTTSCATPELPEMPYYPVEPMEPVSPVPTAKREVGRKVSATVCRSMFVDMGSKEVIINPIIDPDTKRPRGVRLTVEEGIEVSGVQPRGETIRWHNLDGSPDTDQRPNGCAQRSLRLVSVQTGKGERDLVIVPQGSGIHDGERADVSGVGAVSDTLIHHDPFAIKGETPTASSVLALRRSLEAVG